MVFFSVIVYTAFGLMCVWFVISGVRKLNQEKQNPQLSDLYDDEKAHDEAIKQSGEFELDYFDRVRNGEQTQQFLAIAGQPASAMIRSLLCAAGIPSYAENEHINAMYAMNNINSASAFAIKVFILVADYDRAYEVVTDFLAKQERAEEKEKAEGEEESAAKTAKKVAGAVMTGLFFMPMPDGSESKAMGVTILPKAEYQ